jgi:hypothetical protein
MHTTGASPREQRVDDACSGPSTAVELEPKRDEQLQPASKATHLERLGRLNRALASWTGELEVTSQLVVRIALGVASLGGALRLLGLI